MKFPALKRKPSRSIAAHARPVLMLLTVCGFMAACTAMIPGAMTKWSDLGPNEVLLVGNFELDPPIQDGETVVHPATKRTFLSNVTQTFDPKEVDPPSSFGILGGAWRGGSMDVGIYTRVPNQTTFLNHQVFYLKMVSGTAYSRGERVYGEMPGKFRVDAKPEDRVVYFGTVRFKRDQNFRISGIEYRDESEAASATLNKYFGPGPALVKRFAVVLDDKGNPAPKQPKYVHVTARAGTTSENK